MKIAELRINLIVQYQNMETPQVQHRAAVMFASEKGQCKNTAPRIGVTGQTVNTPPRLPGPSAAVRKSGPAALHFLIPTFSLTG